MDGHLDGRKEGQNIGKTQWKKPQKINGIRNDKKRESVGSQPKRTELLYIQRAKRTI